MGARALLAFRRGETPEQATDDAWLGALLEADFQRTMTMWQRQWVELKNSEAEESRKIKARRRRRK